MGVEKTRMEQDHTESVDSLNEHIIAQIVEALKTCFGHNMSVST